MFQFPGFAPSGLCIQPPVTPSGCPVTPGFPIRRSPDQSLFDSSPRHIAAYHVLPRFSTPRHPPCTLSSLTTIMRGCRPTVRSDTSIRVKQLPALEILARVAPPHRPQKSTDWRHVRWEPVVPNPHHLGSPAADIPRTSGMACLRRTCVRFFNCQRACTTTPAARPVRRGELSTVPQAGSSSSRLMSFFGTHPASPPAALRTAIILCKIRGYE